VSGDTSVPGAVSMSRDFLVLLVSMSFPVAGT